MYQWLCAKPWCIPLFYNNTHSMLTWMLQKSGELPRDAVVGNVQLRGPSPGAGEQRQSGV